LPDPATYSFTDTIAALATGTGGAIAVVRLSGPRAIEIADSIFRPATGGPLASREGYTIIYGRIVEGAPNASGSADAAPMVDEVLVSVFRAPRSYTGEDMVEISAHASPYVTHRILELLIAAGARLAEAGEFTQRAFLAGKMDLSQAEAVADLIASTDRASHALATAQLRGGYSDLFASLRGELLRLSSLLELELDFSEEDVTFADLAQLDAVMARLEERTAQLAASFSLGNALKEGIPVVIAGEPNVGKSTLLNALVGEDRAMVSDIAGTTRDVIEESIVLGGVRFRFLDTAGLRESADRLEQMGIERTRASIARTRIVLWMADALALLTAPGDFAAPPFPLRDDQQIYLILNKADRLTAEQAARLDVILGGITAAPEQAPVLIAAKSGMNIEAVKTLLERSVELAPLYTGQTVVSAARHHEALLHAREALARAREALAQGLPADLLAEELRGALHFLGTITGEITTDDILGEIFSKFCIGK
jgi:tRNA modification GTPase